jgi:hypothetical protein
MDVPPADILTLPDVQAAEVPQHPAITAGKESFTGNFKVHRG